MSLKRDLSRRKEVRSILERVSSIEEDLLRLVDAINKSFGDMKNELEAVSTVTDAVISIIGQEQVSAAVVAVKAKALEDRSAASKAALEKGVEAGVVVKANVIGINSVLVCIERDNKGIPVPPGRAQLTFNSVKPEFQAQLLGKGVGEKIATSSGGEFEVTEVYDVVPPKEESSNEGEEVTEEAAIEAALAAEQPTSPEVVQDKSPTLSDVVPSVPSV